MPERDLDDADVFASLEHVCGEAVTQRIRPEIGIRTAGVACLDERGTSGRIGQVGQWSPTGKERAPTPVGFPDLAEHLEDRFGQRENALFVSLPLPTTRGSTTCFESTAETGSVTASVMRKP